MDPTTDALIRAALALADNRLIGRADAFRALTDAAAAYRAAHPEVGRDGDE